MLQPQLDFSKSGEQRILLQSQFATSVAQYDQGAGQMLFNVASPKEYVFDVCHTIYKPI